MSVHGRRLEWPRVLRVDHQQSLERLRAEVEQGAVLAIPTESSYGLATDPRSALGVERIFRIKGRQDTNPLPVVVSSRRQAEELGVDTKHPLWEWAERFWPAPLSVIVPTAVPLPAQRGEAGLAVRIPALPELNELLESMGTGLTATSANRSGSAPLLRPRGLEDLFADEPATWVLDAGELPGGPPSTMVAWNARCGRPVVLRRGAFDLSDSAAD